MCETQVLRGYAVVRVCGQRLLQWGYGVLRASSHQSYKAKQTQCLRMPRRLPQHLSNQHISTGDIPGTQPRACLLEFALYHRRHHSPGFMSSCPTSHRDNCC